jgi:hypothetical protein
MAMPIAGHNYAISLESNISQDPLFSELFNVFGIVEGY